jgi:hypothetical protein
MTNDVNISKDLASAYGFIMSDDITIDDGGK